MAKLAVAPVLPPIDLNVRTRRFELGDLTTLGIWLISRLRERYPHLDERTIAGFLRGLITSNEHLFLATIDEHGKPTGVVGLAQMVRDSLDPVPWIREIFVLAQEVENRNLAVEEGPAIYAAIDRWAKTVGAKEIEVETIMKLHDVPREAIKAAIPYAMYARERTVFKIGEARYVPNKERA
jgi:hypothetical protein